MYGVLTESPLLWYFEVMKITINDKDIKRFERQLKTFKKQAYPFATKATLNTSAFKSRGFAQDGIKRKMTLRNRFTLQSIRVEQARGLNVDKQRSFMGSIADYMADQEFGTTKIKKGKRGVPLPTSFAAGQGQDAQPRTRLPKRANKLQTIALRNRRKKGSSRKQQNLIAIKQAAASSRKFVYLHLDRTEGIFKVVGGKRKPRIKMVYNLSHTAVRIPRTPWLSPAIAKTTPFMAGIYRDALLFQVRRHGLFDGRG